MKKSHPPQAQHSINTLLKFSGDKDFITLLQENSPPAAVVESLRRFAQALPEDVLQNTASIKIGWSLDITPDEVTPYITLAGKNRANI